MRTTVASREPISVAAATRRPHLHPHPSVLCASAISIFRLFWMWTKLHLLLLSLTSRFAHFNGWKIIWRFHSAKRDGSYQQRKSFDHDQQCNNRKKKVISFKWSCIRVLGIGHDSLLKLWCECGTRSETARERWRRRCQPTGSVHFDNLTISVAERLPATIRSRTRTSDHFFFRSHPSDTDTAQQSCKNVRLFHF